MGVPPVIRTFQTSDLPQLRELFLEYGASVGNNICFQSFEAEVAGLPGACAPPSGEILIATGGGNLAGCVAFRPLDDGICEMKRLYVRPGYRGTGLGGALARAAISEATSRGYRVLRLDTLPSMLRAMQLYRELGFTEIPPYGDNPVSAICYEVVLSI
ncbi:MAG TPA: GNAT family N-acetyltransferase [Bryobacteraceae bacterium]|nr:GNAT family N-acetyltransferase [Bryobacteraceae bacterium]